MKKLFALTLALLATFALADEQRYGTNFTRYFGSGSLDNDVLFTSGDLGRYDACVLMPTAGTVDVYASLDGTNFSTAAIALQDHGSTSVEPVLEAASNRVYSFVGKYIFVRVLQKGATPAAASMNCWKL